MKNQRSLCLRTRKSAILSAMNRKAVLCAVALATGLSFGGPISGWADDAAAAIAAGGLLPRRETRIVMAKEVLRISDKKVVVDYDFRNETDEEVTTEVAFPIPPYKNDFPEGSASAQSFKSFRLWVDGERIHYEAEAKAFLKGRNVTGILEQNHIDIPTFGHFDDTKDQVFVPDFSRLPKTAQNRLLKEGLFEDQGSLIYSLWTVHLQYHWTQVFPAHSTVHIRHEYAPAVGFTQVTSTAVDDSLARPAANRSARGDSDGMKLLAGFCADRQFLNALGRKLKESELQAKTSDERLMAGTSYPHWVDFILTSANTWQRPIEDFTLILERPRSEQGGRFLVSFCSPGNVERLDVDHFQVHLDNFVPTAELHIGFFDLPKSKPVKPEAAKR